ncbi:hypothetical protein GJ744_001298 [Endocarpon pusillum]|uniref:Uncharacterized protein n=1 Tax=Endocarpon pusillum TaxID=364733 RepID=A0A8H7ABR4_9EURO|nr:hypothetical protein GJ744_001298 [Endocarpon pusillum]
MQYALSNSRQNLNCLIDDPSVMNTAYAASNQSSSSDSGLAQSNDTVQISDHDLDFVQQTTQLDMSFLRYLSNTFPMPCQDELPYFDTDFTT